MAQLKSTVVQGSLSVTDKVYIEGKALIDLVYPQDSIYITLNDTNPAVLFGGQWEQIHDRFLFASGTYTKEHFGGREKRALAAAFGNINGNNSLAAYQTTAITPFQADTANNPGFRVTTTASTSNFSYWSHAVPVTEAASEYADDTTIRTDTATNKALVSFMPPYFVVHMWRRTG